MLLEILLTVCSKVHTIYVPRLTVAEISPALVSMVWYCN